MIFRIIRNLFIDINIGCALNLYLANLTKQAGFTMQLRYFVYTEDDHRDLEVGNPLIQSWNDAIETGERYGLEEVDLGCLLQMLVLHRDLMQILKRVLVL